jgi:large subunit ribosomal protein L16
MGKGKGNPEFWVSVVKRERVIAEISGVSEVEARKIFKGVSYKLPIKVGFVKSSTEPVAELKATG